MKKLTYAQLTSNIAYYLELYPHVGVALEATLEDVEGDGGMAKEVRSAMERIYAGEGDVKVLNEWAVNTGSRDLEKLASTIEKAYEKDLDIGYYARRVAPRSSKKQGKSFGKQHENYKRRLRD